MTKDSTQTPATSNLARLVDMMLGYVTGLVTATQRSNEIAHKFNIDAVHIQTSTANHIRHHKSPNIQTCRGVDDKRCAKFPGVGVGIFIIIVVDTSRVCFVVANMKIKKESVLLLGLWSKILTQVTYSVTFKQDNKLIALVHSIPVIPKPESP